MTKIIRLIWRFDFDPNWQFLDRRGSTLRILHETVPAFFTRIGDGSIVDSFAAEHTESDSSRKFSTEVASINGSFEWYKGIDIDKLLISKSFRDCDKLFTALSNLYDLNIIRRAGLRTIGVSTNIKRVCNRSFDGWVHPDISNEITSHFGAPRDVGIVIDGQGDDQLYYRANIGPIAIKNIEMNIPSASELQAKQLHDDYLHFFDIDLFEINFKMSNRSLYRWASTKIDKIEGFLPLLDKMFVGSSAS
ncbi:hypothetical protein E8E01_01640 [Methylorubrum populi]|uniref:hypothetical protein n=1 Tax=Methylorubrum populi TaxID=223967 RepID=UPI00114ED9FB|nr:hypothetical protein [Methylorubrum populi]QDI79218.1 hypothetical protein E8E01_01640 [Methylorubrum populi]